MEKTIKYFTVDLFHPYYIDYYLDAFNYIESSEQEFVPIIISSYGGAVDGLTPLLDAIDECKKPCITVVSGMSMSCGSILSASGTKGLRFIGPNARYMIHQALSATFGKASEVMSDAKELNRITEELVYKRLDKCAGRGEGYTLNLIKENMNADLFLNAQQTVEHGYADKIASKNYVLNNINKIIDEWKLNAGK